MATQFQSPFEKLSADNQAAIIKELKGISSLLGDTAKKTTEAGKGGSTRDIGKSTEAFAEGISSLITSINKFNKIDEKSIAHFVDQIIYVIKPFEKLTTIETKGGLLETIESAQKISESAVSFGLGLIKSIPVFLAARPFAKTAGDLITSTINILNVELLEKLKISEIDESQTEGLAKLKILSEGIIAFGENIIKSIPIYAKAKMFAKISARLIANIITTFDTVIAERLKKVSDGGETTNLEKLKDISEGIITFGQTILKSIPVYLPLKKKVVDMIFSSVEYIIEKQNTVLSTVGSVKQFKAMKQLQLQAQSITSFGTAILLALPIYMAASVAIVPVMLLIKFTTWVFSKMAGKKMKDGVKDGSSTLLKVSASLLLFAGAIIFAGYAVVKDWNALIAIAGMVTFAVGIVWALSKIDKDARKASISMLIISGSIFVLTGAMTFWSQANIQYDQILTLGATLLMLAGAFWVVGKVGPGTIAKGALALLLVGPVLWVLSWGITKWQDAKVKWSDVAILGATILMLGAEFSVAGILIGLIAAGAIAIALVGLALVPLGWGLGKFKKEVGVWTKDDSESLEYAIGSVKAAFGAGEGLLKGVFNTVGAAVDLPGIMLNAASVAIGALTIGFAVDKLALARTLNWKKEDSLSVEMAIATLKTVFGGGKGFLKGISNAAGGFMDAIGAGSQAHAINTAARTLVSVNSSLIQAKQLNWTFEHSRSIEMAIATLKGVFGGGKGVWASTKNLLGGFLDGGAASGQSKTLKLAAKTLIDIGSSLKVFGDLRIPINELAGENGKIARIVSAVSGVFTGIGEGEGGFFSFLSPSELKKGIKSMSGIGEIMGGMGVGVKAFSEVGDISTIGTNMQSFISSLSSMGNMDKKALDNFKKMGSHFSDLSIEMDLGGLDMATNSMATLADGIVRVSQSLSTLNMDNVRGVSKMFEHMGHAGENTTAIQQAIGSLGDLMDKGINDMGANISSSITGAPLPDNVTNVTVPGISNKDIVAELKLMRAQINAKLGQVDDSLKAGIDVDITNPQVLKD